ncbi:hypothetical protein Taro_025646 [Colocasia esculenta]|uniref:Pentatricopeptide repeat-containing protein n=1 Tax=Colocasia esculenta TaxID=4460 RepID=A0A843VL30_COLES|nr:hypothetical protein [Colocasia esculenta]
MGVTAAALLTRLLQHVSRHRATPASSSGKLSRSPIGRILAHLQAGDLQKAVALLAASPVALPDSVYARFLQLCSVRKALVEARKVESHLVAFSSSPPIFLLNRTIEAYAKCGNLRDARELFDEMPRRDGGTWNAMIVAYAQAGHASEAVSLFLSMNNAGVYANGITFACVLSSCGDVLALFLAMQIHSLILKHGFGHNVILGSSLVDVYGKCHLIGDARKMFDEIESPNPVSWNVMVRRYLEAGNEVEALCIFFRMIREGFRPLNFTFSNVLTACCYMMAHVEGRQVHGIAVKIAFETDQVVSTSLVEMYAKCGLLHEACQVYDQCGPRNVVTQTSILSGYTKHGRTDEAEVLFDKMPERNVISWNTMFAAYVRSLSWEKALDFTRMMLRETEKIDQVTIGLILNTCAGLSDVYIGRQVHGFAYRHGFHSNHFVRNSLLDMYGKCGCLSIAELLFTQMASSRDIISWNALLSNYARHGRSEEALSIFSKMQEEITPNEFILSTCLAACSKVLSLKHGKQIHGYVIRNYHETDVVMRGALVDMYSKCRSLGHAVHVFEEEGPRDVVLWNSIILGCAYNGVGGGILDLFELMQKEDILPDCITFIGILLGCINEGMVETVKNVKDVWRKSSTKVSWCSWLSRQSNTLKVSGSSPGDAIAHFSASDQPKGPRWVSGPANPGGPCRLRFQGSDGPEDEDFDTAKCKKQPTSSTVRSP